MPRRLAAPLLLLVVIVIASAGLFRLKFDTDILSMLPGELPEVKGLKVFHESFSRTDQLIILIEGSEEDEGTLGEAAKSLVEKLQADGQVKRARSQPLWMNEPAGLSELLAYLWLNGDPETALAQARRLSPGESRNTIQGALDRVATTLEGQDLAMRAHDPFGFLDHPALKSLIESSGQEGEAFESASGRAHLVFVDAPHPMPGYREADEWIAKVRKSVTEWQKGDGKGLKAGFTGEPAFSAEIGRSMEKDLSGSIAATLGLIAVLFWWMQRRLSLLLGLTVVLALVFGVALGIAGWLYGSLSIMALSSAEILIGLSVDYGLVICQEAKVIGHDTKALRAASGRPVLWGALTTTVVFLALNLGGLPGMAQLGTIVAVGLAAAAAIMLVFYLPFVAKFGVDREPARGTGRILPRSRMAWTITAGLTLVSAAILGLMGMPGVEFDSKIMRPRHSEAMETLDKVMAEFPRWTDRSLGVVIEAEDDAEMLERIEEAKGRLEKAGPAIVGQAKFPDGWWPDELRQIGNRSALARVAIERERLLAEADLAGFSEEGIALGRSVLESLGELARKSGTIFPETEAATEITRVLASRNPEGGGAFLGTLEPAEGADPEGKDYDRFRAITGDGIWLSSWGMFKPAISRLVKEDMTRMLIPMFVLLAAMMVVIFRRAGDVLRALGAMVFSTLLLLAIMTVAGLKWNFVNLLATPLLLGTGIDYAIHVTLTLRRTGGCFKDLWNGTGKALLFCGASNVIGFGSLCFSSSDALISLGTVAVIGILLSMATSIFLLPGWKERTFPADSPPA